MEDDVLSPEEQPEQSGRGDIEQHLRSLADDGALSHGWILNGPQGAGKATLAYRVARGLLDPSALNDDNSFDVPDEARVFRLIAGGAHPDLFVAERLWDEKKSRYQTEITVETVRKLIAFMSRTPAEGGYRVAIVDTADDMNRNAANALLKVLEEPPSKTLLMLLSSTPGRLPATIRSRCRRIHLPPMPDEEIVKLLEDDGVAADEARNIAQAAQGRPGYAKRLVATGGIDAISMAESFVKAAVARRDTHHFSSQLTGKAGDARWEIFKDAVVDNLSASARRAALGAAEKEFDSVTPDRWISAWEDASTLIARGEALNLDRQQLIRALAYDLRMTLGAGVA